MQAIYTQANKQVELADLSKRLLAFTLDALLLLTLIGLIDYFTISSNEQAVIFKPERILDITLGWLYFAGMETCACQGTLGKYLLGLKVSDYTSENRISFKSATIRYFIKPISVLLFVLRYLFNSSANLRRPLHDRLAHSKVIMR